MKVIFDATKLVRDNVPEILAKKNIDIKTSTLKPEEYHQALCEKLFEEADEAMHAKNNDELCGEIADLLEVIDYIAANAGIDMKQIQTQKIAKKANKGGFDKKIFIETIEMDENNPAVEYYAKQPDKYPLVIDIEDIEE